MIERNEKVTWLLAVLTLYGSRIADVLDMGLRDSDVEQLYEAAKKFVEAYEDGMKS